MKKNILPLMLSLLLGAAACNNDASETGGNSSATTSTTETTTPPTASSEPTLSSVLSNSDVPQNIRDQVTKSDKLVIVDYWADWCGPCKALKPHLESLAKKNSDKVELVEINVDNNRPLAQALRIEGIPLLHIFKNDALIWTNVGYIDEANLAAVISKL